MYTKEELLKKKKGELIAIAKRMKMETKGKKKEDIVNLILTNQLIASSITSNKFKSKAMRKYWERRKREL